MNQQTRKPDTPGEADTGRAHRSASASPPLAWPSGWRAWLLFVPAMAIALLTGIVSALLTSPVWLVGLVVLLAPLVIPVSCFLG